jgi:hypothetical protein
MGSLTAGRDAEPVGPAWLAQVTAGQRWVVAGLAIQFLVFKTLEPSSGLIGELLMWSIAFGCCWVGTAKIATALKLGASARVTGLLCVGCLSLLGYAYLFRAANRNMRPRGYQLGFFGASEAFDMDRALQDALEVIPQAQRRDLEQSFEQASRSRRRAFVLSFCLGTLGVDRFYLGQVGWGFLKLFTASGFLLWWFADLFLIQAAADRHNQQLLRALVRIHRTGG